MKQLTVFTPTYNRAYCLKNLFDSLKNQTCKNFVWLIVDDGSTDDTTKLLGTFQKERCIDIQVYNQPNGGKHVAHNRAVELCETELFVCVDSDDTLPVNAIDLILQNYNRFKEENILGLCMRKIYKDGENIASAYPSGMEYCGIEDLYHKHNFSGDTALVFKTDLIKKYKFPVFEGERFVTESVLYNQLNDIAPMALVEDAVTVCEYIADGLSSNFKKLIVNNPYGVSVGCLCEAAFGYRLLYKAKSYAQYLALIRVFGLDKEKTKLFPRPNVMVRCLACGVLVHYTRLFRRLKMEC